MKTIAAILLLLTSCRLAPAQLKESNQLAPNVRIYEPKNMNSSRAAKVAEFVTSLLGGAATVGWSDVPHALVIRAANSANLDAAEALLKRFDVAEYKEESVTTPQFDCLVYLIRASTSAARPDHPGPPTSPVPAELQSAIDEMKQTFAYDHYSLWDAQVIHPGGAGDIQGLLPAAPNGRLYIYSMAYKYYGRIQKGMEISDFQFSIKIPSDMKDGIESHIKTSVSIREGQKQVLGKIRLLPSENADLFLVLATKPR